MTVESADNILAAMERVWRECMTNGGTPDFMEVRDEVGHWHRIYSDQHQRFERIFTPAGLRDLFPGLR